MALGESFEVLGISWFQIRFTENRGMAFGMELGGDWGKLILSSFRIIVVSFMGYFITRLVKKRVSYWLLACVSLIFAGALGNILDSIFYGILFSDSGTFHIPRVAEFMPEEGGYAPVLFGKVVDMLYFPLFEGFLPEWVPFWGGDYVLFFRPIFNIADSAISIGVVLALLFYRRFQKELDPPKPLNEAAPLVEHLPEPNDPTPPLPPQG